MSLGHLRSLLITDPLIVLLTIAFGTVSFVATFFDSSGRLPDQLARAWGRALLRVSRVRLSTEGLDKIDPRQRYVFVANHRSYMDIPAVLSSILQGASISTLKRTHVARRVRVAIGKFNR